MVARPRRCSARLSTVPAAAPSTAGSNGGGAVRSAAAAALAARRRQRAAERQLEVEDSPSVLRDKCRRLAQALATAKHLVVYTGAGISTAAAIPDYRGPSGVWTRLRQGQSPPRVDVARARPTFTHMALSALHARGLLRFVVSQNCDGLHLRAGLPRRALAELHGDMYAERCHACRRVYLRAFDTTERTARHAHGTRRLCHGCGRELSDSIVHFGERGRAAWPLNWAGALRHAARADVVLCLGSSLKVLRRYPRLWRMQAAPRDRPRLYIVNLQWTPKDGGAALKINARCDAVMAQVARRLGLRVPRYEPRADPLLAHAVPLAAGERHTTRARPLSAAPPSDDSSDDELPLRALQARLRASPDGSPTPALRAFRVPLSTGDATVLLLPRHAPRPPKAPPWPALGAEPERGSSSDCGDGDSDSEPECKGANGSNGSVMKSEPGAKKEWMGSCSWELKRSLEVAGALAAAYIARAVVVCRAQLYPGLHTILPPAAGSGGGSGPQCSWCLRRRGSARCLWYGPPPPLAAPRAPHPSTGAPCACCERPPATERRAAPPTAPADHCAGWYGKGYRKGRRR